MTDLNISDVNFTSIREGLKNFLKNQPQFSDYNFEGSAMSVLIDILAANTLYNATFSNLAFSETFLDTANQRSSVVSRAKELGYLPRSKKAAKANITLSFSVSGNPSQYVVEKNTKFTTSLNGKSFTFVTTVDEIFTNVANTFTKTIEIAQGVLTQFLYTVDLNDTSQRFVIPSFDVDTDYLIVSKKDSISDTTYDEMTVIKDLNIGEIGNDTDVYFIQQSFDQQYEVYFGDGVIGKAVETGNVVKLDYLITDGKLANGAATFTLSSTLPSVTGLSILTEDVANGGSDIETVESIKYLAPFFYQTQNRAVSETDYMTILKNGYANIDDIAVWGGEKNDPPFYGKVYIAIKPTVGLKFSASEKQAIVNDVVAKYNIVGIRPEIVDADYIYVTVNSKISYSSRIFNRTNNNTLENDITNAIEEFFDTSVNKFGNPLYFSRLVSAIDAVSSVVKQNITDIVLEKRKEIIAGTATQYKFNFNNAIAPNSINSNEITINAVNYFIKDVPLGTSPYTNGKLVIYRLEDTTPIYLSEDAGTVDYNTGAVIISSLAIDDIVEDPTNKILTMTAAQGDFVDADAPAVHVSDMNVYTNGRNEIVVLKEINLTLVADPS